MTLPDGALHFLASHHERLICPEQTTFHGAPDRWNWSTVIDRVTSLWRRDALAERVVKAMTLTQREAMWLDPSEQGAMLRRAARRIA